MNIRTLCLGILSRGDATGYEIKKMAEEGLFSHFVEASFGSIYPALTRMTDEGPTVKRLRALRLPDIRHPLPRNNSAFDMMLPL